jgi:MFS family permease
MNANPSTPEAPADPIVHLLDDRLTSRILPVVAFTFVAYFCIGLPIAILPTYVHRTFGANVVLAGLLISLQYIATFASRPYAGHASDRSGPKTVVTLGLSACAVSGLMMAAASLLHTRAWLSLGILALSRLALGYGESMTSTGAMMWGMGRVGSANTALCISWNGIATYTALAVGAPVGALLEPRFGFASVGIVVLLVSAAGLAMALNLEGILPVHAKRPPMRSILRGVLPYGLALATGGLGFGVIASFIALYFLQFNWQGASMSLTIYGVSFVTARVIFVGLIDRFGGYRVAAVSFLVEAVGLGCLAVPHRPLAFLGSCLTGLGFSLIFPALGVEAAHAFPQSVRGSVLGIYSSFVDFSLFVAGPLAGAVINSYGYSVLFSGTAAAVAAALCGTLWLRQHKLQVSS